MSNNNRNLYRIKCVYFFFDYVVHLQKRKQLNFFKPSIDCCDTTPSKMPRTNEPNPNRPIFLLFFYLRFLTRFVPRYKEDESHGAAYAQRTCTFALIDSLLLHWIAQCLPRLSYPSSVFNWISVHDIRVQIQRFIALFQSNQVINAYLRSNETAYSLRVTSPMKPLTV